MPRNECLYRCALDNPLPQAIYEASSHWVTERNHDDWNRASYLLRCLRGGHGACGDDVGLEAQAFGGEGGKSFATPVSGKVVDADGLPVHIAQIAQSLEERFKSRRPQCTGIKRKETEPRDVLGLLGLRRKRPRDCRTTNERDELASSHGLPSSGQRRYATTFLSENAVVHHSKISQPMSQLGQGRHCRQRRCAAYVRCSPTATVNL